MEKNFFLKTYLCFLQNIRYLQKKIFLYGKKNFIEKNITENVKKIYPISEIYFLNTKCLRYKQNLS